MRNSINNSLEQTKIVTKNSNESPTKLTSKFLNESVHLKQGLKESQNKILEMIFNEKILKKKLEEDYILSPQKIKKSVHFYFFQ